ncbi:MAG: HEAT repeat domain-containing protein [Methanoculleus sp.]|uniref:HEAT repeat domain-containing protein n=1 Tax=unclassified Methanoculleus TaxID=2619537 RepID=UPI0025DF4912|nr:MULTISPECIES: HEAT repeat domain-containing protein [unclassified Methanoculleus]MCK9318557.1 HEAT repeat domain-containing protein [Methanoculleus sp.]MDD2253114.1 HEAT repeat domain-containing protein [Methanoculleus sp.]MDD4313318.1 HEAT repeat domain-containing protein [Methanoculleus sp.]MDD4471830.1 HEAT repeat domain-containing protein [Methanoculleus sp.]
MKPLRLDIADISRLISKGDVRGLISALRSDEKDLRWMAVGGLGELRDVAAVDPLICALSDPDSDVRWKVAEALGSIGDSRATEALIPLLKDPDETTRLQAIWALGKICDPRATTDVVHCMSDADHDIKVAAIWALGKIRDQRADVALREKLLDRHSGIRAQAAESLEACGWRPYDRREKGILAFARRDWKELSRHSRPVIDVLIWALNDEYFDVRMHAAQILGNARSRYAVQYLHRAIDDPVEAVSYEAVAALAEIADPRSIQALVHGLESNFLSTRKLAAGALDRLNWKPKTLYHRILFLSAKDDWIGLIKLRQYGIVPLTRELQERQVVERENITKALKIVGNLATEPLIRLLESPDPDIRWRAASLLGDGHDRRAVEPLIAALEDLDGRISNSAAIALGEIGDQIAVDPLIQAFKTGDADLRKCSIVALGKIRSGRSFAIIIAASGDENSGVRISAIQAMGSIGDARLLPALLSFCLEPDPTIRIEAIRALSSYPRRETTDLFIQALGDPDAGIRREACDVLGKRKVAAAIQPLTALLEDSDAEVRQSTVRALNAIGWKPANAREQLGYLVAKEDWKEIRRLGLIKSPFSNPKIVKPLLVPEDMPGRTPDIAGPEKTASDVNAAASDVNAEETESEARKGSQTTDDSIPELHFFIKALADPHGDPAVRLRAAEALGKFGDLRGVQPLMSALTDPDAELRWRAALSLGMLGDQRAFSALVVALDDPVFEVKRRAAESIAVLRSSGAVRPLCELMKSPDPATRSLAIETLGEYQDDEAVRTLFVALEDMHTDVKSAALSSLLKLADYWTSRVTVFLKDEDPAIRRNVVSTLKTLLGEEEAVSHLVPLLRSGSFSSRREVLSALEMSGWQPALPEERVTVLIAERRWDEVAALGKQAIGPLIDALFDTDGEVKSGAVAALEDMGDGETVQSIKAVLRKRSDLPVKGVYAAMKVISLISEKERRAAETEGREDDSPCSTTM